MIAPFVNATELAHRGGWYVPDGWQVFLHWRYDTRTHPDTVTYDSDDYLAYVCNDWRFVTVIAQLYDADAQIMGWSSLHGCEYGWFPHTIRMIDPVSAERPYIDGLIAQTMLAARNAVWASVQTGADRGTYPE